MDQIAISTSELSKGVSEITTSTQEINEAAHEAATGANDTNVASIGLAELERNLSNWSDSLK